MILLFIFLAAVLGYAYFEARSILYGPRINIEVPEGPITTSEQFIVIRGVAENIKEIRMNGLVIPVTEEGIFEEPVLLSPGYNTITFAARDKLGRETEEVVDIVYRENSERSEHVPRDPVKSLHSLSLINILKHAKEKNSSQTTEDGRLKRRAGQQGN